MIRYTSKEREEGEKRNDDERSAAAPAARGGKDEADQGVGDFIEVPWRQRETVDTSLLKL